MKQNKAPEDSAKRSLERLNRALSLSRGGQLIIIPTDDKKVRASLFPDMTKVDISKMIRSVSDALSSIEIRRIAVIDIRSKTVGRKEFEALNRQRAQFLKKGPVILLVGEEQAKEIARIAPDIWNWATIMHWGTIHTPELPTLGPATGKIDDEFYASRLPPVRDLPKQKFKLKAPSLEDDRNE